LNERAAERDVEHLDPAAYAEKGKVCFDGGGDELDFESIALAVDAVGGGVNPGGTIPGGINIGSSGYEESVDQIEDPADVIDQRRENDRETAAVGDRRGVGLVQRVAAEGSMRLGVERGRRRDADHGCHSHAYLPTGPTEPATKTAIIGRRDPDRGRDNTPLT
jgi:hypothetical protein